ncbi:hypothetical protein [Leptolyngbya ohadii]|nr:hypothetical protein [Leptolyngbya ohadii]
MEGQKATADKTNFVSAVWSGFDAGRHPVGPNLRRSTGMKYNVDLEK